MAKAKTTDTNEELRKLISTPKAVIGAKQTLKSLRQGKMSRIFLAKNVKDSIKKDVEAYAKIAKVPITELELGNHELGTICRKPYSISVLGELK